MIELPIYESPFTTKKKVIGVVGCCRINRQTDRRDEKCSGAGDSNESSAKVIKAFEQDIKAMDYRSSTQACV